MKVVLLIVFIPVSRGPRVDQLCQERNSLLVLVESEFVLALIVLLGEVHIRTAQEGRYIALEAPAEHQTVDVILVPLGVSVDILVCRLRDPDKAVDSPFSIARKPVEVDTLVTDIRPDLLVERHTDGA